MRAVAPGGKGLWFKQALESALEGGLVAFNRQEVIAPLLVENLLGALHLGVQGIAQHDLAGQVQALEQLAGRGNLVALGRGDHPAQILAGAIGGVDHFHPAVAHLLAIDDDQSVLDGAGQPRLPGQEHPLQHRRIHRRQHPGKGGLFGVAIAPRLRLAPKTQGTQLPLAERVGELGQIVGPLAHARGQGHDDQTNHPRHRIAQRLVAAKLRQLPAQRFHEAADFFDRAGAAGPGLGFDHGPVRG